MSSRPFLSIVVPTRDRPDLLRNALWSVANQTDSDFEIIVSDNPELIPARTVYDEVFQDDARASYVRPVEPVDMVTNWNFGVEKARGRYVTILEDKFALHLDAVKYLKSVIQDFGETDIINWSADVYRPESNDGKCISGNFFLRKRKATAPFKYNPSDVIAKRFLHDVQRGHEGGMYGIGKIVFGAFHRDLISRITDSTGKLFHNFAPDYTSMTAGLMLAKDGLDVGKSVCIAVSSTLSNGNLCQAHVSHAERFFSTFGALDDIIEQLPIKSVPTPCHNIVGHAYLAIQRLLEDEQYQLNWAGLYLRCEHELRLVQWTSNEEHDEHFKRLKQSRVLFPFKLKAILAFRDFLIFLKLPKLTLKFEAWIFRSHDIDPLDPEIWKLWTDDYVLVQSNTPNKGLIFQLKYESLRRTLLETVKSSPSKFESSMIEKFSDKFDHLDEDLQVFVKTLIEDREAQSAAHKAEISTLQSKLENFRGMIGRRDIKIEKLESKLKKS